MKYRLLLDGTRITGVITDEFSDANPFGSGPIVETDLQPAELLERCIFTEGSVLDAGPAPDTFYRYDLNKRQWIDPRPIEELRAVKWAEMKAERTAREQGGFTYLGKKFDSDPTSQARINSAAQDAMLSRVAGEPYENVWTMSDNSTMPMDAEGTMGMALALGEHTRAVHAKGRELRAEIEAADIKAIKTIAWI